ncbi:MAG TPA: DnaJ domain-containing protein [Tepidisphaeraceae bacterium]|nr:DnaJ domain-containing protein [Tepidisphaeraceae bacterium]
MAQSVSAKREKNDADTRAAPAEGQSFADLFHRTQHKQSVCMLAILSWVAACDGRIPRREQELLDKISEAVDDPQELGVIEAAVRQPQGRDLEVACRYLKRNLDRGGRKLLVQLAVTMAIQDGYLTVTENLVLQFIADLMGFSPRGLGKLFEQIARRPFPQAGDPSSIKWWLERTAGKQARPANLSGSDSQDDLEPSAADEPMTYSIALRVMGLEPGATREAIHAAYRRLAKTRHPDRYAPLGSAAVATATEAFKRLHEAYAILSA